MSAAQACGDPFCACGCGTWMGQCARQWPRVVYVGPTCPPPEMLGEVTGIGDERLLDTYRQRLTPFEFEVTAPPLTGVFTFPPSIPMSDQDPRETETLAPETDREAPTSRENEKPAPRIAMNPAPLPEATQGDSYFAAAARDFAASLVEMRGIRADIVKGFNGHGSKLDEMAREFSANYQLLSGEFKSFRGVVEARLEDGERRFDAIEARLDELKNEQLAAADRALEAAKKIAALETELRLLKEAHGTARQTPTAPAG